MGFPCKYTNSQCGTSADYGGHAVPEDSAGDRFSETDAETQSLAGCSSGKKERTEEQAARKKATDKESQKRRCGRMQALKS